MRKKNYNKTRSIKFRVTEEEYRSILDAMDARTITSVSEYCRICVQDPQSFYAKKQLSQLKDIVFLLRKILSSMEHLERNIDPDRDGSFSADAASSILSETRSRIAGIEESLTEYMEENTLWQSQK